MEGAGVMRGGEGGAGKKAKVNVCLGYPVLGLKGKS